MLQRTIDIFSGNGFKRLIQKDNEKENIRFQIQIIKNIV